MCRIAIQLIYKEWLWAANLTIPILNMTIITGQYPTTQQYWGYLRGIFVDLHRNETGWHNQDSELARENFLWTFSQANEQLAMASLIIS